MYMLYKNLLPKLTNYLTQNCKLLIPNIDKFFDQLALVEGELFIMRKRQE